MDREERRKKIKEFRNRDIEGKCVILKPATTAYAENIVKLRNQSKNLYWFNQTDDITLNSQKEWFESYAQAEDDIYWCIFNKENHFIGTIRLYGIDLNGEFCEEGSYVIDEAVADEAPYAVESKMMALDVAFGELEIKTMINDNRADNKTMNNIDNQLGFNKGTIVKIREVDFLHRVLTADGYWKNRVKFSSLIDYWNER